MSKCEWLQLDKLLSAYKQVLNVPFGGVHIVLVGDFLQTPPVGDEPIYVDPRTKPSPSTRDIEAFQLWRRFKTVVVLEESVRFRNDPEWGEGCRNARLGVWTPELVDIINSRVRRPDAAAVCTNALTVCVTPENAKRLNINNAFMAETASQLPANVYPIRIVANFKSTLNNLSCSDVAHVMSLPDNRIERWAPYLDLVDGMPVQVTQNVAPPKGVANDTLGTLDSVHFPPTTTFRRVQDGATGTIVHVPNQRPDYALLRLPRPRALSLRPGLDPELFPVFATAEPFSKTTVSLPAAPNAQRRGVAVKLQQFPFVVAVGSTVFKVQGETLDAMVVVDWKSKIYIINKPQQCYLLVSRSTYRHAFTALSPFTPQLVKWSKPPIHALDEEIRLNQISRETLAVFSASTVPAAAAHAAPVPRMPARTTTMTAETAEPPAAAAPVSIMPAAVVEITVTTEEERAG